MSIYAFPEAAGVKLRSGYVVFRVGGESWRNLWFNVATNADGLNAWSHWVKPQIDALHAVGGNCVSLLFSVGLRYGSVSATRLTLHELSGLVDLVCDYAASLGMWVFPSIGDCSQFDEWGASDANMQAYITEISGYLALKPNVLGIVAMDEIDIDGGSHPSIYDNAGLWMAAARAGFTTRSVPVTCSVGAAAGDYAIAAPIVAAGADFVAVNGFGTGAVTGGPASIWDDWVWNASGSPDDVTDVPVVIASAGYDGISGYNATNAASMYTAIRSWARRNRIQMTGIWTIVNYDAGSGGYFGMYQSTQDGSYALTAPRTAETDLFATFPIVPGAYDSADDGGALVESAPSVTRRTASKLAVAWSAAVGGHGTITYTPQYVEVNAKGFPLTPWQSASSTTSTSATMSLRNARYATRVKGEGAPGSSGTGVATTYSAWAISEPATVAARTV